MCSERRRRRRQKERAFVCFPRFLSFLVHILLLGLWYPYSSSICGQLEGRTSSKYPMVPWAKVNHTQFRFVLISPRPDSCLTCVCTFVVWDNCCDLLLFFLHVFFFSSHVPSDVLTSCERELVSTTYSRRQTFSWDLLYPNLLQLTCSLWG